MKENGTVNFRLRFSVIDGSIESDPSLKEFTMKDAVGLIISPNKSVICDEAKRNVKIIADEAGILG